MIKANVKYVDGLRFIGVAESGHAVVMDSSPKFGGTDQGPRPMELLLLGLGGCTGMDVAYVLRKKKQEVEDIEISLEGDMAEKEPRRFTDVKIKFTVKGKGLGREAVEKAIKLSMERYCSVKGTFEGSAKVGWSFEVVET
ncbi:MAG: OsmC family protein [Nitrospirota bacterium]|jgi:putative redox protein